MHFIWVSMYFSTKVLTGNTIFKSPTGDETAILRGPAIFRAKAVPSFPSYFKTLSIDPLPGIERSTSRSTIKSSTDWDNPAAVTITIEDHTIHPLLARSLDTQLFVTNVWWKPFFLTCLPDLLPWVVWKQLSYLQSESLRKLISPTINWPAPLLYLAPANIGSNN